MKNKTGKVFEFKNIESFKKIGKAILGLVLIAVILFDSRQFLKTFDLGSTLHLLRTFSPLRLSIFCFIGLFAIWLTFLYDYNALRRLKISIPILRTMKVSWIANTFNNVAGFGGLGGAGIRMLLYRNDTDKEESIIKLNLLIIPATVTGLGVLMLIDLASFGGIQEMINQHLWMIFLIAAFILYIPIYCWFTDVKISRTKFHIAHHPDHNETTTRILLTSVSALDWAMAALVLWSVASYIHPGISYLDSIGIFSLATAIGIASMIPGGIGSFDLMLLSGLQLHGASSDEALATLLLFRFFYYLIPLIVGAILSISEFSLVLHKFGKGLVNFSFFSDIDKSMPSYRNPGLLLGDLAVKMLYFMVLIGGILLIISASTPGIPDRIQFLSDVLSLPILQISHRISLFIGLVLILISHELLKKIRRSWITILLFLGLGAIFTFTKGMDFEEAIYMFVTFVLLLLSKPVFFRISAPFSAEKTGFSIILTIAATFFYILSGQPLSFSFINSHSGISMLHFKANDFLVNGLTALILSWMIYGAWHKFLQKPIFPETPTSEMELNRVNEYLSQHNGNEHTHLIFMRDKKLFWACNGEVLIPYQVARQYLIILGDPVSDKHLLPSALNEFETFSDSYGYLPVFYQISEKMMPILHEYSFNFFKLGEEAHLNLEAFDITLPHYKGLRNARNRIEREGYSFDILLKNEAIEAKLPELKTVSDQWLDQRKEKRFSLGFFDEAYLKRSPIALIKNQAGAIIAFASLMPAYKGQEEISVDLMRYIPEGPNGLMDYLFLNLFLWTKNQGYKYFNFGMAPLFNVGKTRFSRNEEALAAVLYQHGSRIYSFEGLYQYKNKFKPEWHPRYLAYPSDKNLISVLIRTARLIN